MAAKSIKERKKNTKENNFFMFGLIMKNIKKNKILLNLVRILCILKLFNPYIIEEIKWNQFLKTYKNNLLILNLFFILFRFFFHFTSKNADDDAWKLKKGLEW